MSMQIQTKKSMNLKLNLRLMGLHHVSAQAIFLFVLDEPTFHIIDSDLAPLERARRRKSLLIGPRS